MKKKEPKKKEEPKKDSEKSELEEKIEKPKKETEEDEDFEEDEIIEFVPRGKSRAPVLNKINSLEIIPQNLEKNLKTATHLPAKEEDSFKYANDKKENGESKYQNFNLNYSPEIISTPEKIRNERIREVQFLESGEARISPEKNFEKYEKVRRFDRETFGKQSDLEKKEIKYKPLN